MQINIKNPQWHMLKEQVVKVFQSAERRHQLNRFATPCAARHFIEKRALVAMTVTGQKAT